MLGKFKDAIKDLKTVSVPASSCDKLGTAAEAGVQQKQQLVPCVPASSRVRHGGMSRG
jgi:hypothetical protein